MTPIVQRWAAFSVLTFASWGMAPVVQAEDALTEGEPESVLQARTFNSLYAKFCLKYLYDLDSLRDMMAPVPQLAPEQAMLLLQGQPGDAWPVHDANGDFVVVVPKLRKECSVAGRAVDTTAVSAFFAKHLAVAPDPLTAKTLKDEDLVPSADEAAQGAVPQHRVTYEWHGPDAPVLMRFTLVTAPGSTQGLQAWGTASLLMPSDLKSE
ncbi:NMCC_0638 family (lipo)protein [Pokkaliibacter sp. CJK22405]|uniref:NMCC_0638 family (lipo)protein n=1 Tax=Pokkaliibacter sp. CJK22405 TaxID=3384615 RepID=UPI003984D3C7